MCFRKPISIRDAMTQCRFSSIGTVTFENGKDFTSAFFCHKRSELAKRAMLCLLHCKP
jgi:hypothetical protein